MKIIWFAAAIAAPGLATPTFAQERSNGHYEWQSRQLPGPNKSKRSLRVRVWVKGVSEQDAHRDCDMMRSDAAGCMKMASGKRMTHSKV
ncbi:MAG: hypothetical protein KKA44_16870 [Alphaproteobacteria bacterium]|jgi:hypothetical protein|nr:hypothetical protein [Alphaproteobacteria bacterium]MBU0864756.1 hypothetical protein [Alphaproteobacteria bacterium]MBU1826625.1 hypothetical protein [Alphaproteobacteria bacterium]